MIQRVRSIVFAVLFWLKIQDSENKKIRIYEQKYSDQARSDLAERGFRAKAVA